MKIRCTHCGTEYELDEALLVEGDFHVACTACHRVFHAPPPGESGEEGGEAAGEEPEEKEMDQLLAEMEETLAGLEKLDLEKPSPREPLPAALETDVPPEMAELKAAEVPPELLFETAPEPRRGVSLPGILFLVLLGTLLAGQLAWLKRDLWLDRPELRALVEQWCPYLGCTLPPKENRIAFTLIDGGLEPAAPRQYRLRLLLRNGADQEQPLPALQVSLTDDQQRLVARRTFEAPVYTERKGTGPETLAAGEILEVELLLAVPSDRVAGYEVELIPAGA